MGACDRAARDCNEVTKTKPHNEQRKRGREKSKGRLAWRRVEDTTLTFLDLVEAPEVDWRFRSRLVGRRLLPLVSAGEP